MYQVTSKIGIAVIDLIQHMVSDFNAPIVVILSAAMVFLITVLTILSALSTPISFAIISIRYYRYMGGQKRHHILAIRLQLLHIEGHPLSIRKIRWWHLKALWSKARIGLNWMYNRVGMAISLYRMIRILNGLPVWIRIPGRWITRISRSWMQDHFYHRNSRMRRCHC